MKILISPSKTMKKVKGSFDCDHLFEKEKNFLYNYLKTMSLSTIKKTFLTSDKLTRDVFNDYQTFIEDSPAILTYTGAQYKALDYETLDDSSKQYLNDHLYIMSGLYGLLRPLDAVAYYRLPMGITLNKQSMDAYWKEAINHHLKEEDLIINLASDEYGDLLNHSNLVKILFYQSVKPLKRANSMEVKKLRGLFLKFLASKKILNKDDLSQFNQEGYALDESLSDEKTMTFVKS